jgi:DNA-binding CsgD family transcriptional regulator
MPGLPPQPPSRLREPVLVGREREQAILREALDAMLGGHGSLVLVSGEAGIGKTTLVEWLAREAEAEGCLVLSGGCYDLTATPPYGPWIEALVPYSAGDSSPPPPPFVSDFDALSSLGSQERLFAATRDFLLDVARSRPLVVALEDLHWADQGSLELLRVCARAVRQQRVLLLVTYRHDEPAHRPPLQQILPLLIREASAVRVAATPLDERAITYLIMSRYTLEPSSAHRLVAWLVDRSEGNPFFLHELLRTLEEQRVLQFLADGGWQIDDFTHVRVPALVRQVIEARLDRLGQRARDLLQIGAVLGQEVPLDLWQQVTGADDQTLVDALKQGRSAYLLEETVTGDAWRFTHALFRESLYEDLLSLRKRSLHRTVAEQLEELSSPDADQIAYHFQQAGDARAIEWLIRAGERAEATYAWLTAAERFEAAAILTATDAAEPRTLLLARSATLRRHADPAMSVIALEAAWRASVAAKNPALSAYTLFELGLLRCYVGALRDGLESMEAGVNGLDALSSSERAHLNSLKLHIGADNGRGHFAAWLSNSGRFEEALAQSALVLSGHSSANDADATDRRSCGSAFTAIGDAHCALGRPEDAHHAYLQAISEFNAQRDYGQACWVAAITLDYSVLRYRSDDLAERRRLAEESEQAGKRISGTVAILPPQLVLLPMMGVEGQWDELRELAEPLYGNLHKLGFAMFIAPALGRVARGQGDVDLAWSMVRELVPGGPATEPGNGLYVQSLDQFRLGVGLALDEGDAVTARIWLEAHDRWLDWASAVLGRAEAALLWAQYHQLANEPRLAREKAIQALALASEPRQPLVLTAAHRYLGRLNVQAGAFDQAEDHLHRSLDLADACAAPFERAQTLLELAELRLAQGRSDEVTILLSEVRATCKTLRALPTLTRLATLEKRLSRQRSRQRTALGLTPREDDVLRMILEGMTDREIANALSISHFTVMRHVSNILNKLGVNSRTAAVALALKHDLV